MDKEITRTKIAEALSTCGPPGGPAGGIILTEEEIEQAFNGWIRTLESLKDEVKKDPEMFVMHFSQYRDIVANEESYTQIGPLVTELFVCDWRNDQEDV